MNDNHPLTEGTYVDSDTSKPVMFHYFVANYPDCGGFPPDMHLCSDAAEVKRKAQASADEVEDADEEVPFFGHLKVYADGTFDMVDVEVVWPDETEEDEEEEEEEEDEDEWQADWSKDRPNHCTQCEGYFSDTEYVRYYNKCYGCCHGGE